MTTDQDLTMDGQAATAVFAAKGIDVTTSKDQGVIKVCIAIALDLNVLFKLKWDSLFHHMAWS